jgi:hypothetical protein
MGMTTIFGVLFGSLSFIVTKDETNPLFLLSNIFSRGEYWVQMRAKPISAS